MAPLKNGHVPRLLATEYASYRDEVIRVLVSELKTAQQSRRRPLVLYDPMAGTAPLLPLAECLGFAAYFNDLNPLHLYVNAAKTFESYSTFTASGHAELKSFFRGVARSLDRCPRRPTNTWIETSVLSKLAQAWEAGERRRGRIRDLIRAVLLLAVRHFSSFVRTTNPTWLKPGGLRPSVSASSVFRSALDHLCAFYSAAYGSGNAIKGGHIFLTACDASESAPRVSIDVVVTSPPFCNRVDWDRLYAPERFLLNAVGQCCNQKAFLGTTAVRAYPEFESDLEFVTQCSPLLKQFLLKVKKRQRPRERHSDYYPKYYTRYFAGLLRILDKTMPALGKSNFGAYFVVQDNIHRGTFIEIGKVIAEFLDIRGYQTSMLRDPWEVPHLGLRNISRKYRLASPKQLEFIWHAVRSR